MELALIQLNESLMSTDLSPIIFVVTLWTLDSEWFLVSDYQKKETNSVLDILTYICSCSQHTLSTAHSIKQMSGVGAELEFGCTLRMTIPQTEGRLITACTQRGHVSTTVAKLFLVYYKWPSSVFNHLFVKDSKCRLSLCIA